MADIPHSSLSGAELHDVLGASTATAGSILAADGNGSVWVPPEQAFRTIFGITEIVNNTNTQAITAAGDGELHTPADFSLVENFVELVTDGITVENNGTFTMQLDGVYTFTFFISLTMSTGSTLIGLSAIRDGVSTSLDSPVMKVRGKEADNVFTLSGSALGVFSVGENIGLGVACDVGTTLLVNEANITAQRIGNL